MSTLVRRRTSPVAEMLRWLESDEPLGIFSLGLAPVVRVEDYRDGDTYVLRAEMPGIDPDRDVQLTVDDDVLTIRGERREETREKDRHELHYGAFERSMMLPHGTRSDDISASYVDGVLELRVPVDGEAQAPRTIPVQRVTPEA